MKFHMLITLSSGGRHGRDPMVVGFTTSRAISGAVYSIQHFVKMFVCDFLQIIGFLWVTRFPLGINLTAMI